MNTISYIYYAVKIKSKGQNPQQLLRVMANTRWPSGWGWRPSRDICVNGKTSISFHSISRISRVASLFWSLSMHSVTVM